MKKSIKNTGVVAIINTGVVAIILISVIFAIYGIFYLNTIIKKS